MASVKCNICDRIFSSEKSLNEHKNDEHVVAIASKTKKMKRKTEGVGSSAKCKSAKENLDLIKCESCKIEIQKCRMHAHKRTNEHKNSCSEFYKDNDIEIIKTAFKSRISTYRVNNRKSDELSIKSFLNNIKTSVLFLINENLQTHKSLKVNVEIFCGYMLEKINKLEYDTKSFNTKNEVITISTKLNEVYDTWMDSINTKSEDFSERESGWHLLEILYLEVNINKYDPLRGSSYIELPEIIRNRKACVNVKNFDDECFGHAIISALRPVNQNSDMLRSYPNFRTVLNFNDIEFPIKFSDIDKFERRNDISVNVFGLNQKQDKVMGPLHHTKQRRATHINLLYFENNYGLSHFCWIKNLSRLVGSQLSSNKRQKHICDGCLQYYAREDLLLEHQKDECGKVKTILPFGGKLY